MLHLSEHAAYRRIEAARAARRFPVILELLEQGTLTLTAVGLLVPLLTLENHAELLKSAQHKSRREVEALLAALQPQPDVPSRIRKLPSQEPTRRTFDALREQPCMAAPPPRSEDRPQRRPTITPLAPARYKLQLTMEQQTHDKLRRAQDLLRHIIPNGDPAAIFDRALTQLLAELERTRMARTDRPRGPRDGNLKSRYVPAAVRRAVWTRDGGQCAFVGTEGRCTERGFLELHHVVPYSAGGETTSENLELRCRAHNQYEAEQFFSLQSPIVRERPVLYSTSQAVEH